MNLITPVHIEKSKFEILPTTQLMTIGSCFSVHMGDKLTDHRYNCLSNPFNTIFNPCSIVQILTYATKGQKEQPIKVDNHQGRYFNYDFHTSYDATSPELVKKKILTSISDSYASIQSLDVLIITFGTSIGYIHIETEKLVSNCHKVPNHQFRREFIDDDLMYDSMFDVINLLRSSRPDLHIIFTVSPVRHTKEGLIGNSKSKSKLLQLCHKLTDQLDNTTYFPSYEIMMDELRDYRFYKEDMIHPSYQAVDIIWQRFMETYFSESAKDKVIAFKKLNQAVSHRPFDPSSEGHQKFISKQLSIVSQLQTKYPEVNFDKYLGFFNPKF